MNYLKPILFLCMTVLFINGQAQVLRTYHTYIGGEKSDLVADFGVDGEGTQYLLCGTKSYTNIATAGAFITSNITVGAGSNRGLNSFLVKLTSNGKVKKWGTYLSCGTASVSTRASKFDSVSNSIYIIMQVPCTSFSYGAGVHKATKAGGGMLLMRMDTAGQPVWTTYFGGLPNVNENVLNLDLDKKGNIYVVGNTKSDTAIATPGAYQTQITPPKSTASSFDVTDGFLMAFDSTGNKIFGTYFGGNRNDNINEITIKDSAIYVSGITWSDTTLSTKGVYLESYAGSSFTSSNFLAKFNLKGQRLWFSYMPSQIMGLKVLDNDDILICGRTDNDSLISTGHILNDTLQALSDAYLMRFSPNGKRLLGRYIGGNDLETLLNVEQFNDSTIGIVGLTRSNNLQVVQPYDAIYGGNEDAIFGIIDDSLNIKMLSYYGGSERDYGLAIHYKAPFITLSGHTKSTGLGTQGVYQPVINGEDDGFIAKFSYNACKFYEPILSLTSDSTNCFNGSDGKASVSLSSQIPNYNYNWSSGAIGDIAKGLAAGVYKITVSDTLGCAYTDSIEIYEPHKIENTIAVLDSILCYGDSTGQLKVLANGGSLGYNYRWNTGDTLAAIVGLKAGNYIVTTTDRKNCQNQDVITLTQPDSLSISLSITDESKLGKADGNAFATVTGGVVPYNFKWSDGSSSFQASNLSAGSFSVVITDNNGCKQNVEFTINDLSVGIDVHNNQRAYRVYPNPTNGELMLEFYNSEIISLNVRDVTGKELWNIDLELGQEKTILDLQQLNSGLYFLHLLGQDKNYIVPVVKQ
jgi:hypothetical protein